MTVTIIYHREADGWWAESPDAPGYTAAAPSFTEARDQARTGLGFHLERDDLEFTELGVPIVSHWAVLVGSEATSGQIRELVEEQHRHSEVMVAS